MSTSQIVLMAEYLLTAIGILVFFTGLVKLLFIPASLLFEIRERSRNRNAPPQILVEQPMVSVLVPAYNEAKVLANCVSSILASDYRNIEVLLINDGSTDETGALMSRLVDEDERVRFLDKPNGGKASALNLGISETTGDYLLFVDADGVFRPDTISRMLGGFTNERVGAVSGDDRPVNLDRILPRFLSLISHVGTGFIRRALTLVHCMPVVDRKSVV